LRELATNPLLLTLLCLVFEEQAGFPANRSELYKEGVDVLLKKWDVKRNIRREQVYKQLSLQRKEDLLSQVAFTAFVGSEYFFKQKFVEEQIRDYIRNLPNANDDPEALQLDSEAVLKSIEAQHGLLVERARGIYSFSHLTFQEYFTARQFKEKSEGEFSDLVCHITEERWQEIFYLTVGMLKNANKLLQAMKLQIDSLLAQDEKLQQFLTWVEQKSRSVDAPYKPAAIRAFYLARARDLALDLALDLARARDLALALAHHRDPELQRKLQQFKEQLPSTDNWEDYKQWWRTNGQAWIEQLRTAMIQHCNIGHDWHFTEAQKELLQQYYNANILLVDCLNSDCYVSREVREEIEATLLLPYDRTR
jgi:predicted NACHT family NTPase